MSSNPLNITRRNVNEKELIFFVDTRGHLPPVRLCEVPHVTVPDLVPDSGERADPDRAEVYVGDEVPDGDGPVSTTTVRRVPT